MMGPTGHIDQRIIEYLKMIIRSTEQGLAPEVLANLALLQE